MAFFDQLSTKLTQTGQSAVQKTKDMAEVVRLNGLISEKERKIENWYREIGKLYYEHFADRDEELFRSCVAEIRNAESELAGMQDTVRRLKGTQTCPACGKEQPSSVTFCNGCGAKLAAAPAQPSGTDGVACPSCGAIMGRDMAFCTNCGARLEQENGEGNT